MTEGRVGQGTARETDKATGPDRASIAAFGVAGGTPGVCPEIGEDADNHIEKVASVEMALREIAPYAGTGEVVVVGVGVVVVVDEVVVAA